MFALHLFMIRVKIDGLLESECVVVQYVVWMAESHRSVQMTNDDRISCTSRKVLFYM
jgi:hypothetical protein